MILAEAVSGPGHTSVSTVLITALPLLASILSAVIAGLYASRVKLSENEAQRLRNLESLISDRKYDTYKPMISLFGDLLNKEKQAKLMKGNEIATRLHEFATWASIYASDDALRSFRNLMQASYANAPGEVYLRLYSEFVLAARRDIGQPETATSVEDMLSMRITDIYKRGGLIWVVQEPFEEVCRRVDWDPPWGISSHAVAGHRKWQDWHKSIGWSRKKVKSVKQKREGKDG